MDTKPMKLDNHILREVGELSRTIHAIVEVKFKDLGLQKGQFIYITRICENPGINLIQLSTLLKVDKTTTTKVIQRLIENDFILKRQDSNDKRSYKIYPKNKALLAYKSIIEEENKSINACFSDFDDDEKELVYNLIKKMRTNVENKWYEIKNY